jgi:hypothetical protein
MWETILGGAIALIGVTLTQLWQGRRESDRWKREASYDERKKAYTAFIEAFSSFQRATERWETSSAQPIPPSMHDGDVLNPLYDCLTPIRVYGTWEAHERAQLAIPAMWDYMMTDGHGDEQYTRVEEAIGRFIEEVRADLDIPDPGRNDPNCPPDKPQSRFRRVIALLSRSRR